MIGIRASRLNPRVFGIDIQFVFDDEYLGACLCRRPIRCGVIAIGAGQNDAQVRSQSFETLRPFQSVDARQHDVDDCEIRLVGLHESSAARMSLALPTTFSPA